MVGVGAGGNGEDCGCSEGSFQGLVHHVANVLVGSGDQVF